YVKYMHDESMSSNGGIKLHSLEYFQLDIIYNINTMYDDFKWVIHSEIFGNFRGLKEPLLYCYSYSSNNYIHFDNIIREGSFSDQIFNLPLECTSTSPLKLRIYHSAPSGGFDERDTFRMKEEWITYRDPNVDYCSDGCCGDSEDTTSCPADCYERWNIDFISPPSSANSGEKPNLQVKIKNTGNTAGTTKVLAAIYPDKWQGDKFYSLSKLFSPIMMDIANCCSGEVFVQTKHITLDVNDEVTLTFDNITAQDPDTDSPCEGNAWDNSFTLFAGTFEDCNEEYTNKTLVDFSIIECTDTIYCDPCLDKQDGNQAENTCDCNSECSSGYCDAPVEPVINTCEYDRSDGYNHYTELYDYTCGGEGYVFSTSNLALDCSWIEDGGSEGYVCDSDHDGGRLDPCRINIGYSCEYNYECWNDDVTFCNSVDICSDGSNGLPCGLNLDCNSGRCDSTCMAKLVDWSVCDENSDCISNICLDSLCRPSSTLCGDDYCENDRGENVDNCWEDCGCDIIDGSSYICDCDSDSDCKIYGDYICEQSSGWDACINKTYENECGNPDEYFCEEGDLYQCLDNGKYYQKVLIDYCGLNSRCDGNSILTGSCTADDLNVWIDNSGIGATVNKQKGDKLILNIRTENPGNFEINYDSNFFEGDCNLGIVSLIAGLNSCNLDVKEDAKINSTYIIVNEEKVKVNILDSAHLLVITDSEKLYQRFPNEPEGVDAVLKQAYSNAEENGIVYDLSYYDLGRENPFDNIWNYNEKISQPSMLDNSYSLAVSEFVKKKCDIDKDGIGCKDVMIVGDDFVVPSYRRDISLERGILWWKERQISNIYTDTNYIQRKYTPFSEFDTLFMDERGAEKNIAFAIQNGLNQDMLSAIENLRDTLENKYQLSITNLDPDELSCNSYPQLKEKTVFFIGNFEDNPLLNCYPFVELPENADVISIEPNIWDVGFNSIIMDTVDDNVIDSFNIFITNEDYKITQKNALYYIKSTVSICELTGIIPAVDVIGDVCAVTGDCILEREWGWCGTDMVMLFIPIGSAYHAKIFKKVADWGAPFLKFAYRYRLATVELYQKLSKYGDDIVKKVFKQLDDFDLSRNGDDAGKWTIKQANKIGQTIKKIESGEKIKVYKYVPEKYFDDVINENTFATIKWLDNPKVGKSDRFKRAIYSSLDPETAKKEILANSEPGTKYRLFTAEFSTSKHIDEGYKIVPSARTANGVNIVDFTYGDPDIATKPIITSKNIDNYPPLEVPQ
ncbi:MAG: hypothetical protein ABIJ08_05055, partial [Nanoarchaeota archaeon]